MSGTFHHIEVYEEADEHCSVCGALGKVEWSDVSTKIDVRQFRVGRVTCPNGPHRLTPAQWLSVKAATVPQAGRSVGPSPPGAGAGGPRRTKDRWWQRGQP
jgi:hypothetical protein